MKKYRIVFSPKAHEQMAQLGEYIAEKANKTVAANYLAGIEKQCQNLKTFPHRGRILDELSLNLRIMGYKRRVNIVFSIYPDQIIIQGIFHGGQDIDSHFADMDS